MVKIPMKTLLKSNSSRVELVEINENGGWLEAGVGWGSLSH